MDPRHVSKMNFNKRSDGRTAADLSTLPNDGTLAEKSLFACGELNISAHRRVTGVDLRMENTREPRGGRRD